MMNYPGVLVADPEVLRKIALAEGARKPVDGHAPGLTGVDLNAYVAAGMEIYTGKDGILSGDVAGKVLVDANSATLTPKSLPKAVDPKLIAALKKKLGALKSALARYQTTAKAYLEKAKTLQQQEKNIAVLYKKTEAQLKSAMGR